MPGSRQKGYFAPNLKPKGMHLPKRIQERRARASLVPGRRDLQRHKGYARLKGRS